ncbi:hypothetical protein DVH24_009352, partial [Malus domestica]
FVSGNSRATSHWVTHHGTTLATSSLNFGVPTKPEASELPKGLVLGKDGNIDLRITHLGDVEDQWAVSCHILAWASTTSSARLHRSTILLALGPDHTLTVLFLET